MLAKTCSVDHQLSMERKWHREIILTAKFVINEKGSAEVGCFVDFFHPPEKTFANRRNDEEICRKC